MYLPLIDYSPSQYTVWRRINSKRASAVVAMLQTMFFDFSPLMEIMLDNNAAIKPEEVPQGVQALPMRLSSFR